MESIWTKQDGRYQLHSRYSNGLYLAYREDDNWGRASEKSWAVVNKDTKDIIEWQFKIKLSWKEWLTDTIKRFGKRTILNGSNL